MKLLIHTGGTIGMVDGPQGLEPGPGVVERAVGARARVIAFDPLLDSAELNHHHWNRLLDLIEAEDGPVIITHGTDTLSYTGAALSQALVEWPHPVVLTASMVPLGQGGDAENNLERALESDPGPGVWLAFAGRILPAHGLVKTDSHAADAFRAVAMPDDCAAPSLAASPSGAQAARRFADRRIGVLTLTPGLVPDMVAAALAHLDGAVLRVFGAGTMPSTPALHQAVAQALANGCRIRVVSQCENGGVSPGTYAAGASLWALGLENGGLDTVEAAFVRLWLALSAQGDV